MEEELKNQILTLEKRITILESAMVDMNESLIEMLTVKMNTMLNIDDKVIIC